MKIKVFYPNEKGNIELTKEKLEGLLNEAYNEGYRDGKNSNGYYCSGITTTPYRTSVSGRAADIAYLNGDAIKCNGNPITSTADTVNNSYTLTTNDIAGKISTIDIDCVAESAIDALEVKYPKSTLVEYAEG